MDAKRAALKVTVLVDLIRPVKAEAECGALADLKEAGVELLSSAQWLEQRDLDARSSHGTSI